jgi:uncharacterized glyoxalase superfamily protein PhnB
VTDRQPVVPYLLVEGVDKLASFIAEAFAGVEVLRLDRPDGTIMHIEMRIAGSLVMMGEPLDELGPMPASIYLTVPDCDAVYRTAIDAGGASLMEPTTMPHAGERYGGVKDPCGNVWWIATTIEDVPADEAARRVDAMAREGTWPPAEPNA